MRRYFRSTHNRATLLLVFSIFSMLVLLGRAVFLMVDSLVSNWQDNSLTTLGSAVLDASGMLLCVFMLIPLCVGSLRLLKGQDLSSFSLPGARTGFLVLLSIVWIILLAGSSILVGIFEYGWTLAIPGFLLSILIPVVALAWIGAGGLYKGSRLRLWSAFGLGMTGGSSLAILVEYALVAGAVGVIALLVAVHPEWLDLLKTIQTQLANTRDMEELLSILGPYLLQPWLFFAVLVFVAVLGPLIEEAVKPIAVWMLGSQLRSPMEGFALGAISGAGFALIEGLMSASGMVEVLYFVLPARFASSLMHITLSAVMGWAIASAYLNKRWKNMVGIYLLASCVHGMWNGSVLLVVYGALHIQGGNVSSLDPLGLLFMVGGLFLLCAIFIFISIGFPLLNRQLRSQHDVIIAQLETRNERIPDGLDTPGH